jgi:hypothetical protein
MATQQADIERITVQDQPVQKVRDNPFQSMSWTQWHASVVPALWEAIGGGCGLRVVSGKNLKPYLKNN